MTRRIITLLLLATAISSMAQEPRDAREWMQAFAERLSTAKAYHVAAEIQVMNAAKGKVIMTESSEAYVSEGRSYSQLNGRITLVNESEFVVVDPEEKTIMHQARNVEPISEAAPAVDIKAQMLEALNERSGSMRVLEEDKATVTIRVDGGGVGYSATDVVLSKRDLALQRITYHVEPGSGDLGKGQKMDRIVVTYTAFELDGRIPAERFSSRSYLRTAPNGRVTLSPEYATYELVEEPGS
jgi:hypothetical protein